MICDRRSEVPGEACIWTHESDHFCWPSVRETSGHSPGRANQRYLWKDAPMRRDIGTDSATPHLVLLSGGIDSAAALALTLEVGSSASALFVDYGQAAAASEAKASAALATHFGVGYEGLACTGRTFGAGEIRGRNAFLIHFALMVLRQTKAVVVLGIHSGTTYRDCSPSFLQLMQRSYDFHTGGQVSLAAPFVHQLKRDIVRLASEMRVPVDLTYSCEAANVPCGKCMSCHDREELLARS